MLKPPNQLTFLLVYFSRFLNCTTGAKLRKASHIYLKSKDSNLHNTFYSIEWCGGKYGLKFFLKLGLETQAYIQKFWFENFELVKVFNNWILEKMNFILKLNYYWCKETELVFGEKSERTKQPQSAGKGSNLPKMSASLIG